MSIHERQAMNTQEQSHIHVKSYFASSVPDAMEVARTELGADALLLNSRVSPPEVRHLGAVEVVFGVYSENRPVEKATAGAPTPVAPAHVAPANVDELRKKMDQIHNLLIRSAGAQPARHHAVRLIEQVLIDAGLTPETAADIEEAVTLRLHRRPVLEISRARKTHEWEPDSVVQETVTEIESRLAVKPELGRITALVGPPGSGKTTTLVKLAVVEGLMKHRPVLLVSADAERIGGADQLRSYAAILGVPFEHVETSAALSQTIQNAPGSQLILIDTPGLSPALIASAGTDIAAFLTRRQDIDTHLVLTASMRSGDIEAAARRFEIFNPSALIFTRLDETESVGTIANEAIRSNKPISWLCAGQLIPEDIEAASKRRFASELVHQLPGVLRSAA
jgi:flagellar biosynthesis protein FlhF